MNTTSPACDATRTAALLDYGALIDALAAAAIERDDGTIVCPERLVVPMRDGALLLSMPAVAADLAIHKLITVTPGNRGTALPTIQGQVIVLDGGTGRSLMTLDGPTVTGRRTAAMSLLAIRSLAPPIVREVLLIGTGVQARHHVEALAALHPGACVRVRGTSREAAERFCRANRERSPDLAPDDGARSPDVVITCTTSRVPVWREAARAGCLIVAVGSFDPDVAEIGASTVQSSAIVVDDLAGARHEAGDLIRAGIAWSTVRPLVDVLRDPTRRPPGPVVFKSVGCAAWDLAAARVALRA